MSWFYFVSSVVYIRLKPPLIFLIFFLQDMLVLDVLECSSLLQVLVGDNVTRITTLPLVPVPTVFVEQGFFSAMCKRTVRLTYKTLQRTSLMSCFPRSQNDTRQESFHTATAV